MDGSAYNDDPDDDELSTYQNEKENSMGTTEVATSTMFTSVDDHANDDENEISAEATVTSQPQTTVINGFILPLTVRNFFKQPTFNTLKVAGVETVRTSDKKHIEEGPNNVTTSSSNLDITENINVIDTQPSEMFGRATAMPAIRFQTTQPMRSAINEQNEEIVKKELTGTRLEPMDGQSSVTRSDESTAAGEVNTEKELSTSVTGNPLDNDDVVVHSSNLTDSFTRTLGPSNGQDTTTEMFSNKIEEIDIARDGINISDIVTTTDITTQISWDSSNNETAEDVTTEADNDQTELNDIVKEVDIKQEKEKSDSDESEQTQIKKAEKRPASTSPVSDLLNGIYRLISVRPPLIII